MIFDEESSFEEAVISVLKQHGWNDSEGILRYPTEQVLIDNWAKILFNNNSGIDCLNGCPLTKGEMAQIIEQIETAETPLALNGFINGKTIAITRDNPDDTLHLGKEVGLKIYDRQEITAGQSRYQIAQQIKYSAKNKMSNDRRGDLCLLINGMPVIHIELKRSGVPVSQATTQIEKYAHEGVFTGLFRLVQIFVGMTPDEAVYFANPGAEAFDPNFFFHWENFSNEPVCAGNKPDTDEWKLFIRNLLSIPMAHRLIGFYTVADSSDGNLKVMRSYQYYAASAISDKVRECKWNEPRHNNTPGRHGGYIWHTTGSGKTMTSFKSAQLIADSNDADKVVFLMDRIELGTQSLAEYRSFADDTEEVQSTEDTQVLRSKLTSDDPKNRLIVTSIQKMSRLKVDKDGITQSELNQLAAKRIVIIIDECHRSTFGDMLQDIRCAFPNALFFGFTGTPILNENHKKESTTAMVFGNELHRYSIADGIRDGNVLGFDPYMVTTFDDYDVRQAVALEQAKATNIAECYLDNQKNEVFNYYMDSTKVPMGSKTNSAGDHIKGIEDFLNPSQYWPDTTHHRKVVEDILRRFPTLSRGNKFHAILATSSIPEAIDYYRTFKRQAPQMKVTALFDRNIQNTAGATVKQDALVEIIEDYNKTYGQEFTPTPDKWLAMKKDISARLSHKKPYENIDSNRDSRIDLLIVVNQMLTGFDSKWLNTLYLDKVMKYEEIIQAFSRTNRLFGPDKPFGTIRYYRYPHTMKGYIEAAVKLYSGDRPLDMFVQKLPENITQMDMRLHEILMVFEAAGVGDLSELPASQEAKRKFAKEFVELNKFLQAAKVQGFTWEQDTYEFKKESKEGEQLSEPIFVQPDIDERTYLILVQRYKELFSGSTLSDAPDAPYELDGHITEIDTGLIDSDYMDSNFKKWLKCLEQDDEGLEAAREELHRSFASLSQDDQRFAELFLHDVERGDATYEEGMTLRDYITSYAHKDKNNQVQRVIEALGVDGKLLTTMIALDLTNLNINDFGRFDNLKNSVNKVRAKAFFEQKEGKSLSAFKVNVHATKLLKKFILEGGFDIDGYFDIDE